MSNVRILQDVVVNNSLTASDSLYVTNNAVAKNLAVGDFGNTSPDSTKTFYVSGDAFIDGMLTVTGSANFVNTTFSTTSALSVVNNGTGPAIVGVQNGEEAIAAFYDDTNVALWVDGIAARPGHVGIGTKTPNEKLTIVGNISSDGNLFFKTLTAETATFTSSITAHEFIGIGSQLTQVFGTDNTKLPLAGGVLTGGLTGTTALFTDSLSALALSGSFYGNGSGLTNVNDITKLPLSGGVLTDGLTGTIGLFNVSLSAPDLSGSFYGNGSGLTNVNDTTKLALTGGVLTDGLTGTVGVFTISLSAPNLSGSFYGNGSGLTNVVGTDPTKLPLSGGRIDGNLLINGALTALSSATFVNTIFTTTSALSIVNTGVGPALYVYQSPGTGDVASFVDGDGIEVLHVGNNGLVSIATSDPNKTLTVNGEISAKNDIWADKFRGDGSLLTNVLGTDNTKLALSGGTLTGGVTGTTAIFNSISAQSISGTFYGDISNSLGATRYYVTCRASLNQAGQMNTTVTPNTFTYFATGAIPAIDTITPTVGDIILFGAQSTSAQGGAWRVINAGSVGVSAVLERPNFFSGNIKNGTTFTVTKGSNFQGSSYNLYTSPAGANDIVVGLSAILLGTSYTRAASNAVNSTNIFTGTQTLAVGSTTLAPLRFQAGTLLTTPVQHTVEWDGNFMYLTTSGANSARLTNVAFVSAPATSSSFGLSGQVAYDSSFFYVCTAANTWLKTPLSVTGLSQSLDGTKLPLSGGTLTGGVSGTSISATFYGDGGNLFNIPSQINFIFDGAGLPVENNSSGYVQIPYNTKITGWTLLANQNSTSTVQVLTSNFSNHPTYTVISGSVNQPALTNASKASSSTLTGWVTSIPADSYIQFVVTSNTAASNLTISLKCARSS